MRLDAGLEETERRVAAQDTSHWADLVARVVDDCHPEQRDFVNDPARHVVGVVGRGGGKTTGGRARFVKRLLTTPMARCVYIAKTRDHAKRLMWLPLKELFRQLGFVAGRDAIYNETSLSVTLRKTGASLRLCGADKPADIESLRGETFHEVGIDEAASHADQLLVDLIKSVIGPRLVGALWLIGTPGRRLKGLFYEISRRGSKRSRLWADRDAFAGWKGWSLHKWSLKSAIEATRDRPIAALLEVYAAQLIELSEEGLSDNNPNKRREYDGEWAADDTVSVYRYRIHLEGEAAKAAGVPDGTIWNQWDPERVGPMRIAKLPDTYDDWAHVIALDLGFADPTAINVFAFSVSDPTRTIYHRFAYEERGLYAQPIAHRLLGEAMNHATPDGIIGALGEWPNAMVADSQHQMGGMVLAELSNVYGVHIEPAAKGYKYKAGAIDVVNGDLVEGRIKVLKDSELEAQLLDLQWAEGRNGEQIERKDQPNHSTDTLVYARAVISTFITAGTTDLPPRLPRDRNAEPPMPDEVRSEYGHLFQDDYAALLG